MSIQLVKKEESRVANELGKADSGDNNNHNFQKEKIELEDFLRENLNEDFSVISEESPEVKFTKYLWVIKMLEVRLESFRKTAEGYMAHTEKWLGKKESQITNQMNFLLSQMESYLETNNMKSLSLPTGMIGFRKQQSKLEISDLKAFLKNAKEDLIRKIPESYEPNIPKIKAYIKETGEIPRGIEVITQSQKFYYKINSEEN